MKKISLKYIADQLKVSTAVVSVVLNNGAGNIRVSAEVRKKIIDLAKELNYRPNSLARGLKTGKTNTIGLLVSDISNHYYSKVARSVEDVANSYGYNVIFCSSDDSVEKESNLVHLFRERKVDGIILSGTQENPELIRLLEDEGYPLVLIDRDYKESKVPFVGLGKKNQEAAYQAVRHLIENGFKKILLITVYPHLEPMHLREKGYMEALQNSGIQLDPNFVLEIGYGDLYQSIRSGIEKNLSSGFSFDAIFTLNNKLALHALQVLHDLGKVIPDDLGFVCFDDHEIFGFSNPKITAISHFPAEVGQKAVELLIQEMKQLSGVKKYESVSAQLIVRESTTQTQSTNQLNTK